MAGFVPAIHVFEEQNPDFCWGFCLFDYAEDANRATLSRPNDGIVSLAEALQYLRRRRSRRGFDLPKVMHHRIKSGGDEHMGRDKPGPDV